MSASASCERPRTTQPHLRIGGLKPHEPYSLSPLEQRLLTRGDCPPPITRAARFCRSFNECPASPTALATPSLATVADRRRGAIRLHLHHCMSALQQETSAVRLFSLKK